MVWVQTIQNIYTEGLEQNRNISPDDLSRQKYKKSKRQIMFDHEQRVALNWTSLAN